MIWRPGGASGSSAAPGKGLDLSACPHLFPAVVAYEKAVGLEAVRQQADSRLRAALKKEGADPVTPG